MISASKISIMGFGVALLLAMPAHAQTITQTVNYGPAGLFLPPIGSPTFNQFDPTLGTLTGVTFDLSAITSGTLSFENLDSTPAQFTEQLSGVVTLQGLGLPSGSPFFTVTAAMPGISVNLSAFDGTIDEAGPSGYKSSVLASPLATVQYAISSANFGLFTGSGTYTGTLTGHNDIATTGTVPQRSAGSTAVTTSGSVKLTYTYTPFATAGVPEPATWMTLIGGFGMVGGQLRRRQRARPTRYIG